MLRQIIVSLFGNVDAGKCVHPSTLILNKNGILRIDELWKQLTKDREIHKLDEGFYIKLNDFVIDSFDLTTKEIIKSKPIFLCKLKSHKNLISIKTSLGTEIKVTEEHPFFVLENLEIKSKRADSLKEGEFILHAKEINKEGFKLNEIKSFIIDKLTEENQLLCKLNEEFLIEIKNILNSEEQKHNIKNNRFRLQKLKQILNKNNYSNEEIYSKITHIKSSITKKKGGHSSYWIKLPQNEQTFKKFFYLASVS